jgi:predicted small lipoprotein YifL
MKNYLLLLPLLTIVTGCGQIGPLYLPDGSAPVYVPKAEPEPVQKTPAKTQSEPEKSK